MSRLLPEELRGSLPPLYSTEGSLPEDITLYVKFFFPMGRGTWFAAEFDGVDTFFGWVVSPLEPSYDSWGYFSLKEMEDLYVKGLRIERDLHWKPTKFGQLRGGGQ